MLEIKKYLIMGLTVTQIANLTHNTERTVLKTIKGIKNEAR